MLNASLSRSIRVGLQLFHDCSHVAFVGCCIKHCGEAGESAVQVGRSSAVDGEGCSSFGAVLKHCVLSSCGSVSAGAAVAVSAGGSVHLLSCSIHQSLGVSVLVAEKSSILMTKCCIYASAASAVSFLEKSTGQLLHCTILSAGSCGLQLAGCPPAASMFHSKHHIPQGQLASLSPGAASDHATVKASCCLKAAKSLHKM